MAANQFARNSSTVKEGNEVSNELLKRKQIYSKTQIHAWLSGEEKYILIIQNTQRKCRHFLRHTYHHLQKINGNRASST
jgi:hypothetical protein